MKSSYYILFLSNIYWVLPFLCFCNEAQTVSSTKTDNWTKDSSANFVLYAQKGVRSERKLKAIGEQLERTQVELLRLLNESSPQRLHVYFLKDRETLTSYTGFPANGYTNTGKGIIYFVDKDPFHLAYRHELAHALSWRLWGAPKGYWLSEGLAVLASGSCSGYPLHALAQTIEKEGKRTSFQNLTDTFDFRVVEPSLQSASMVKYVYDNHGIAKLKSLWKTGWKDAGHSVGISSDELEKTWLLCIQQPQYSIVINWSNIHARGCE